jgi:hypothetical protein
MHEIRISEGEKDPVYSGTMHQGSLSEVQVSKDGAEIVVNVHPARNVAYRVRVIYEDGRPPEIIRGSG